MTYNIIHYGGLMNPSQKSPDYETFFDVADDFIRKFYTGEPDDIQPNDIKVKMLFELLRPYFNSKVPENEINNIIKKCEECKIEDVIIEKNKTYNMDCFDGMKYIQDHSVDLILTDLPYNTTQAAFDKEIIPLDKLWEQYNRIIKENGAIVLTASQPFTSKLVMSNLEMFKYDYCWEKSRVTGVLNAKIQPLRTKEDVLVFYKKQPTYNPQGLIDCVKQTSTGVSKKGKQGEATGKIKQTETGTYTQTKTNYPKNVIKIASEGNTVHPTQKPVALFEYLINTYSNEGDLVLDSCAGVLTTSIACLNTKRDYICFEKDKTYFELGNERINKWSTK